MSVPFAKPFIGEEEKQEILKVLDSGWLTTGPVTARFEEEFAEYIGRRYAVGTTSCTAALHIALLCCGAGPGKEVVTTPMTWVATANAIAYTGAKPVFADIDPCTLNIDPAEIKKHITKSTVAILPVHLFGNPCDMKKIISIAAEQGKHLVGDCAHAIEAELGLRKVGSFGSIDCFSFWGTKNISTGEGGMLVTNHRWVYNAARELRSFGLDGGSRYPDGHYGQSMLGWKYNMFDIQAALGIHQLRRVEERWSLRSSAASIYDKLLTPLNDYIRMPLQQYGSRHAHHIYPILLKRANRDEVLSFMKSKGIGVGIHYQPVHLEPWYKETYGYKEGDFPIAEDVGRRILSLPFWPEITREQQKEVVSALKEVVSS